MTGAEPEWLATLRSQRAEPVPGERWAELVEAIWPGGHLHEALPMTGGLGGLLDRVRVVARDGREVSAVVRRFMPEWGEVPEHVVGETTTLDVLAAYDVPAPRTVWSDPDGRVLGRPALVMSDLPGSPAAAVLDEEVARFLGRLLAQLHRIPGTAMHHRPDPGDLATQIRRRLERSAVHDDDFTDRAALDAALELAAAHVPGQPETFLHDDFHPGNVIIDGDRASVIDLSWATRGDPGRDLGYCRLDLALTGVPGTTGALLEGYRDAGGVVPEHLWVYDLEAVHHSLPSPAHWLPAFHEQGRDDLTPAVLEQRGRAFLQDAVARGRAAGVLGTLAGDDVRAGSSG